MRRRLFSETSTPVILAFGLLSLAAPPWAASEDPPRTGGIRAIVAADTLRGPQGTVAAEYAVSSLLQAIREMGIPVESETISPEEISPSEIVARIRRLDPARLKDTTLFFYYAGHGATDARGAGHFLRTPRGDLARSVLVQELKAKAAALTLVVTDSCSVESRMNAPAPAVPQPPVRRAVENLLLQHRGVVDVNASTYDATRGIAQAAFYYPGTGGLFTRAFCSTFWPAPDLPAGLLPGGGDRASARDLDGDGFLDWSEAMDHIGARTNREFEDLKATLKTGGLWLNVRAADATLFASQVAQDPQVFGELARRSDRTEPPTASTPTEAPRKVRLGAYLEDRASRGGGYVMVTEVDPGSPAMRAFEWRSGRKAQAPTPLAQGAVITRANGRRVTSRRDFFRIMDAVPEGGELRISGFREGPAGRTSYEASVALDRFE